jgi:predicted enzyme related to lactoylglutathione lyase
MEETMTPAIADHVVQFERGGLSRRQLIEGLGTLVAAAAASPTVSAQGTVLQATAINHTSVLVTDLQRSADFYGRVFGLKTVSEDKPNRIVRLGTGGAGVASTLVSLRQQGPVGTIDHYAISVHGFNRETATRVLKEHGLTPADNIEFGFHVKDPDGAVVQVV